MGSDYFTSGSYEVTGLTESSLDRVRSYNVATPFIAGFNLDALPSENWTGVLEIRDESILYVIGGEVDTVGQYVPNTGVVLETFSALREVEDPMTGEIKEIPLTTFSYYIQ